MPTRNVRTLNQLVAALDERARDIAITAAIVSPHDIILSEGVSLKGEGEGASLLFSESGGLGVTRDNHVQSLRIITNPKSRAIYLRAGAEDFGTLGLEDLTVTGQVAWSPGLDAGKAMSRAAMSTSRSPTRGRFRNSRRNMASTCSRARLHCSIRTATQPAG